MASVVLGDGTFRFLSDFQCNDGQNGEDEGDNPEPDCEFRFKHHTAGFLEHIGAVGLEILVLGAEMVMYRGALEDALFAPVFLSTFVIPHLQYHAETLDEEDAAQEWQQQFFMDDDGTHSDDAADGERPRVAHEYLRRVGVVPEETDECSDEGAHKDHKFL